MPTELTPAPGADAAAGPAPEKKVWTFLAHPFAMGFLFVLGGLLAIALGTAFSDLATIWIYIAFALFAAVGLDPVVRRLQKRGMSRAWSIATVSVGFAVVLGGIIWLILPTVIAQIGQFIASIPSMISDFQKSDFFQTIVDNFGEQAPALLAELQNFLTNPSNIAAIGGGLIQVGASIASTVSGLLIVIVLSLYFLASLDDIKGLVARLAPARSRALVTSLTNQITDSVGGYLSGMVILAFFNSVVTFILHLALGLPFPALMAVAAFCITIIPLIGTVLFWVVASALALFTSPLSALIFALIYAVYMQLEAYLLTPKVMNKSISVPGSLVVIGALVGGTLAGLLGALIAIPVTASILLIVRQVFIPKQDAKI